MNMHKFVFLVGMVAAVVVIQLETLRQVGNSDPYFLQSALALASGISIGYGSLGIVWDSISEVIA